MTEAKTKRLRRQFIAQNNLEIASKEQQEFEKNIRKYNRLPKNNFFLFKFTYRKANKTGGGPKPNVDFPDPDPDIFRSFYMIFGSI